MQASDKIKIEQELKRAAELIFNKVKSSLIPDKGLELVYAAHGARTIDHVGRLVIFPGGLSDQRNQMIQIKFGQISTLTSGILTAMRFSSEIRTLCSLKYSDKVVRICDDMLFWICNLDAEKIPKGVSTMDWSVAFCSDEDEGVPDIISIKGTKSGISSIRVFGETPLLVITNIIKISERISVETL